MAEIDTDKIVKTVELKAPVARVWEVLTDFREFGTWFRVDLDQPFEAGKISTGRMTFPGAEGVCWLAYVEQMDTEDLFSFRWYDSEEGAAEQSDDEPGLLVSFQLEAIHSGTRLTITESGFASLAESRRIELMRGNREGWEIQAGNLATYLTP